MTLISYYFYNDNKFALFNLLSFLKSEPSEDCYYIFFGVNINLTRIIKEYWGNASNYKCVEVKNRNYDFQGFKLSALEFIRSSRFKYLLVLNSTVCGPFLPSYIEKHWSKCFTERFSADHKLGINGATISMLRAGSIEGSYFNKSTGFNLSSIPHVQSFSFCVSRRSIEALFSSGYFSDVPETLKSRNDAITYYELLLSIRLLNLNFKISSLIPNTDVCLDDRKIIIGSNLTTPHCDFMFPDAYRGRTISPYETIFVKTRRFADRLQYLSSLNIANSTISLKANIAK